MYTSIASTLAEIGRLVIDYCTTFHPVYHWSRHYADCPASGNE